MKTIEERALAYSEQVVNDTPFDVINDKVCVRQEDKDICKVARQAYIAGALEQRDIDIEAAWKHFTKGKFFLNEDAKNWEKAFFIQSVKEMEKNEND